MKIENTCIGDTFTNIVCHLWNMFHETFFRDQGISAILLKNIHYSLTCTIISTIIDHIVYCIYKKGKQSLICYQWKSAPACLRCIQAQIKVKFYWCRRKMGWSNANTWHCLKNVKYSLSCYKAWNKNSIHRHSNCLKILIINTWNTHDSHILWTSEIGRFTLKTFSTDSWTPASWSVRYEATRILSFGNWSRFEPFFADVTTSSHSLRWALQALQKLINKSWWNIFQAKSSCSYIEGVISRAWCRLL